MDLGIPSLTTFATPAARPAGASRAALGSAASAKAAPAPPASTLSGGAPLQGAQRATWIERLVIWFVVLATVAGVGMPLLQGML